MYAFYKQATVGECTEKEPSKMQLVKYMKHTAWKKLGPMSKEEAKKGFIETFKKTSPKDAVDKLEAMQEKAREAK